MRSVVQTDHAPRAIGPYSQAIRARGTLLFTAGQIALDPVTGNIVPGGIEEQTRRALTNLRAVVEAGGSTLAQVIKTTVFLANMNDFTTMNSVYQEFFPTAAPARSAVEVSRLPKDALVEIECITLIPE